MSGNTTTSNDDVYLKNACFEGRTDIIAFLLVWDADKNKALYYACCSGQESVVTLIIKKYPDVDYNMGLFGACRGGGIASLLT